MNKRAFAIAAVGVVALVLGAWFATTRVHVADSAPAVALASRYFAALHDGHVPEALALYGGAFPNRSGDTWHRLLSGMQAKTGDVKVAVLENAQAVPNSGLACFLLRYSVERQSGKSAESLVVCPNQDGSLSIVGHEMVNPGTGQRIAAGLAVQTANAKL